MSLYLPVDYDWTTKIYQRGDFDLCMTWITFFLTGLVLLGCFSDCLARGDIALYVAYSVGLQVPAHEQACCGLFFFLFF